MDHVEARALGEQRGVEMRIAADPDGAVAHLAGIGLGVSQQLGKGFWRKVLGGRGEERRHVVDPRHWHDILFIVDGELARKEDRRDRVGRHVTDHERVTVGSRSGHLLDCQDAEGARLVLDDERLAENAAHRLTEHAANDVGRPARSVRDEDLDRFGWIFVLRLCADEADRKAADRQGEHAWPLHDVLHVLLERDDFSSSRPPALPIDGA